MAVWGAVGSPRQARATVGSIGALGEKVKRLVSCFLVVEWYALVFLSFNYSKIANFDSRTYGNTFWIVFGTSNMFTKSGPSHLFLYVEMLQNYNKIMETSSKHIMFDVCIYGVPKFCRIWKRRAPKNPEESSNEISKIMEMGQISIENET